MRRSSLAALALAAALPLSGCLDAAYLNDNSAPARLTARENATTELQRVMESWRRAFNANNHVAVAKHYEDTGSHSTATTTTGINAIAAAAETWVAESDNFRLTERRFILQGDYGVETGVATQDFVDASGTVLATFQGDYMVLLARQQNGDWKIRHLVGGNAAQLP